MTTTAVPMRQKKLSPAGCAPTPEVQAARREIDALSSKLCVQVELIQGLCRTLGAFAWAENLDGLSFKDIGHTALLMEQALDDVREGVGKIGDQTMKLRSQTAA